MSREAIPLSAPDISKFARAMARQLGEAEEKPTHLSLMNMLARSAGFRNYQHLKASHAARERLADGPPVAENADYGLIERVLKQFDSEGQLTRWPAKWPVRKLCLWVMWSNLPAGKVLTEKQVNALLNEAHLFNDPALLRRYLFDYDMVERNRDGTDYKRIEMRPPVEAREIIREVTSRRAASE